MKERIIVENTDLNEELYQDAFEEWCDMNGLNPEEEDIYEFMEDEANRWLEDEYDNLNEPCGDILVIADLGFWNGRKQGYQVIYTNKINGIFNVLGSDYNYFKFYCDTYKVKATLHHHDGTHYLEFYESREGKNIQPLLDKIYDGEEVTNKMINRYCRSLLLKIKKIYGW